MPVTKLYMPCRDGVDRAAVAAAVRTVLQEVIRIPQNDGPVMVFELDREDWHMPPGSAVDRVLVEITMFPGRKPETKARLLAELAQALARTLGIQPTHVLTMLHEPPLDNWGIRGGQQASRVGVGFQLDV